MSPALGVDLGRGEIKVAALARTHRKIRVVGVAVLPAKPDDPRSAARSLQKLCQARGWSGAPCAFGVDLDETTLKWTQMPPVAPEDRLGAAGSIIRRDLNSPLEETFLALHSGADDESLITAVHRDSLDRRANLLLGIGLQPVHAEFEGLSIHRLVQKARAGMVGGASTTVVDLGRRSTRMYILQGNRFRFSRTIAFGADGLIQRLVNDLDIGPDEAVELLHDPDSYLTIQGSLHLPFRNSHAVVSVVEELRLLAREFSRLIKYFRSIHPSRSFGGLLDAFQLTGGLAGLIGLSDFIGQEVGMAVQSLNPFAGLAMDLPADELRSALISPNRFAAAVGLALALEPDFAAPAREVGHVWTRDA
ncbi:MAG: pilus assembly protein PilM [Fimbriimonadaceae bacterium]|nr:pilus assembly protein PilM [Fimbriimonadaceae bacterium]